MQLENWRAVVSAVNVYNDSVLKEMRDFAERLLSDDSYDYVTDYLELLVSHDANKIAGYEMPCWQHEEIALAVEQYKDECHFDALKTLALAMLVRSAAWEVAFN